MIARRIRAAVILIALWGIASGALVTTLAFGIWAIFAPGSVQLLPLLMRTFMMGAEFGMVIGGGFSAMLALRGDRAEPGNVKLPREILGGALLGTVLGTIAFVGIRVLYGVPVSALLRWPQLLAPALILGGVGAIVGPGILAIARRGKALPPAGDLPRQLHSPESP